MDTGSSEVTGAYSEPPSFWDRQTWFRAAKKGNTRTLQTLLDKGVDIDQTDGSNKTAFYYAVKSTNKALIYWLMERGATPDAGISPLQAWLTDIEKTFGHERYKGDDFVTIDYSGNRGNDLMRYLVNTAGCDINKKSGPREETVFHRALARNLTATADFFLTNFERKIDPTICNKKGVSILDAAATGKYAGYEQLDAIAKRKKAQKEQQETAMKKEPAKKQTEQPEPTPQETKAPEAGFWEKRAWFKAAKKGDTETLQNMLDKGFDINLTDGSGHTAFYFAVLKDNQSLTHWLHEKGADANTGISPLLAWHKNIKKIYSAEYYANQDISSPHCPGRGFITHLVRNVGCDINKTSDPKKETLLHKVLSAKHFNTASFLVAEFPDIINPHIHNAADVTASDMAAAVDYRGYKYLCTLPIKQDKPAKEPEQIEQKKTEQPEPETTPDTNTATANKNSAWQMTDESEIARISEKNSIGYKITEIFNFASGTHTTITHNPATKMESTAVIPLEQISAAMLKQAADELTVQGGILTDAVILPISARKKIVVQPLK
ncbi:MAG: ankyrin repeat domain-containing protein [Alphaproteobacteria bacterium]|nr:ankyrin repeat domain-containing protein [Alphaproteobacteria bacterium]